MTAWEEFTPTLEDFTAIAGLPLFGDQKAMWIVIEEEDERTLKLLISALSL